jgi:hypothetical protein
MGPIQRHIFDQLEYMVGDTYILPGEKGRKAFQIGANAVFGPYWDSPLVTRGEEYRMCLAMLYTLAEDQGV